jgi:hypothetical protein
MHSREARACCPVIGNVFCCSVPQCWAALEQSEWQIYLSLVFVILFLFPAIIIAVCYTIMVTAIWTQSHILTPSSNNAASTKSKMLTNIDIHYIQYIPIRKFELRAPIPDPTPRIGTRAETLFDSQRYIWHKASAFSSDASRERIDINPGEGRNQMK